MRCDTNQHPFACGLDWHARTLSVCLMNHNGAILLHRHMQAAPEPLLKAMAPYRAGLVVAVACRVTWSWLAALGAPEGRAFGLGHALSRTALHGGKATTDSSA